MNMTRIIIAMIFAISGLCGVESRKLLLSKGKLLGSDTDNFGCNNSAGYIWCDYKKSCVHVTDDCAQSPSYPDLIMREFHGSQTEKFTFLTFNCSQMENFTFLKM